MEILALAVVAGLATVPVAALVVWARRRSHPHRRLTVPGTLEERERALSRIWEQLDDAVAKSALGPAEPIREPVVSLSEQATLDRLLQQIVNAKRALAYVAADEPDTDAIDAVLEPLWTLEREMEAGAREEESGSGAAAPSVHGRGAFARR